MNITVWLHNTDPPHWTIQSLMFHDCGGNDIGGRTTETMNECLIHCHDTARCIGVVFVEEWIGQNNCFPKRECNPTSTQRDRNMGIHTALLDTGGSLFIFE